MMYPHTITIINSFNERGRLQYYFTVVSNVFYQDKQSVRLGNDYQNTDNRGYVNIPYVKGNEVIRNQYDSDKTYIPEHEWEQLVDKSTHWTLKENDFIVKGLTTQTDPMLIQNKRTIESIEDIDYSIIINAHYGVTLK